MAQTLEAGFLVLHGLVTAAIGAGTLANGPGVPNPAWLGWWPFPLGRSWLLDGVSVGGLGTAAVGGALWIAAGLGLAAAGLGLFGLPGVAGEWPTLSLGGAALSLVALALYFHPYYVVGTLLNVAILLWRAGLLGAARAA